MSDDKATASLSDAHRQELVKESGLSDEVITARGYKTETVKNSIKRLGFSQMQGGVGPWLVIPMYGPGSVTPDTVQIKPTTPRPGSNGKPVKYESPKKSGVVLDVNPRVQGLISDATKPLWITEGVKKGDAIASRGECAISLTGVWGWKMGSLPHESWATVALNGRIVYLAFDSDALDKAGVWDALNALSEFLTKRKAQVRIINLPALHGMAKTGIDDFLASGASLTEARQYVGSMPPRPANERPGMSYRLDDGDTVELTNFTARIIKEVLVDDGVDTRREFIIHAKTQAAEYTFQIPESEFASMQWHLKHIGATAIIYAFSGAIDKTREAIQIESANVETDVQYQHTGWRKIDKQWHYLVSNGAITETGLISSISVNLGLGDRFEKIVLPDAPATKLAAKEAVERSWALVHPRTGVMPLRMYLTAWRSTLGATPYSAWVYGRTGAGKSTLATLLQAHWGKGHEEHRPLASWSDTDNALEEAGFRLKDMLMLIDDWRPKGSARQREEMRVDRVVRSQANASGRMRMTRDLRIRHGRDVRAMVLSTAEAMPQTEPSLVARLLQVPLVDTTRETNERFQRMTLLQGYARRGDLAQAMTCWLMWLAPRLEEVQKAHAKLVDQARDIFKNHRAHARMTTMDADMYAFAQIFFGWVMQYGILTPQEYDDHLQALAEELINQSLEQEQLVQEYSETASMVEALRVAVRGDTARIDGLDLEISGIGEWIGWKESGSLYLSPTSLKVVMEKMIGYRPSTQSMVKALEEGGYMQPADDNSPGRSTMVKKHEGRSVRVWRVDESVLDETADEESDQTETETDESDQET